MNGSFPTVMRRCKFPLVPQTCDLFPKSRFYRKSSIPIQNSMLYNKSGIRLISLKYQVWGMSRKF